MYSFLHISQSTKKSEINSYINFGSSEVFKVERLSKISNVLFSSHFPKYQKKSESNSYVNFGRGEVFKVDWLLLETNQTFLGQDSRVSQFEMDNFKSITFFKL